LDHHLILSQGLITSHVTTVVLLLSLLLLLIQRQACHPQLTTTALIGVLDHSPTTGIMFC
jgi:hypothetical protein